MTKRKHGTCSICLEWKPECENRLGDSIDIYARDKESGLLHLSHMATNIAFMLEMMKEKE